MGTSIKILIAEDHEVVRQGLKILISSDPTLKIAGEADNGETALRLAQRLQPDVVLMDLAMPKCGGLQASKNIRQHVPNSKVLVLSAYHNADTVQELLEAGIAGYMTKHSAAGELLAAIHEVGRGRSYFSRAIARQIQERLRSICQLGNITKREQEVLCLIAQGHPNKEIAFNLKLSIKTVEKHRQAVMNKLGIHDVASLTRYALEKGLIPAPGETVGAAGVPTVAQPK